MDRIEEPRWLDPEEDQAWRAYLLGSRSLEASLDRDLSSHGIGLSEYELLSVLSEAPGERMRMSALADLVVQSRSRVTHTAARLEGRGWVTREACLSDRRGVELVLTADGREAVEEMARVHVASVREHLVDLVSREELLGLGRAMSRVRDLGCAQARAAGLVPDADSDGAGCGGVTDPDRAADSEPLPCPGAPADIDRAADSDLVAGPGTTEDSGRSAEQA